ncbi:PREDICTED: 28S ribosomal protein S9, mitochondrial-like, partial [Priapulus caudatus]|uniref:28S ribosomal protein S9, mitochondrial-like n=1 Tax=Priapulus caudatus TaxID=37621 RepID=A0ABM1F544_PRICU
MMGLDADGMTQRTSTKPSGTCSRRDCSRSGAADDEAPEEIFPKQKAAQFAVDGRPFHHLFYSGLPNYYSIMQDIQQRMEALANYEDEKLRRGILAPDPTQAIMLAGSQWIGQLQLQDLVLEKMDEHM